MIGSFVFDFAKHHNPTSSRWIALLSESYSDIQHSQRLMIEGNVRSLIPIVSLSHLVHIAWSISAECLSNFPSNDSRLKAKFILSNGSSKRPFNDQFSETYRVSDCSCSCKNLVKLSFIVKAFHGQNSLRQVILYHSDPVPSFTTSWITHISIMTSTTSDRYSSSWYALYHAIQPSVIQTPD
jgi:hypothetical protein